MHGGALVVWPGMLFPEQSWFNKAAAITAFFERDSGSEGKHESERATMVIHTLRQRGGLGRAHTHRQK